MPTKDTSTTTSSDSKKGLHLAAERDAKVDDYPERPYTEAMTPEQKAALEADGLLPPGP